MEMIIWEPNIFCIMPNGSMPTAFDETIRQNQLSSH